MPLRLVGRWVLCESFEVSVLTKAAYFVFNSELWEQRSRIKHSYASGKRKTISIL